MKLTIVADENILALEDYFGDLGTLIRVPGRTLSREQLMGADILLVRSVTRVDKQLLAGTPVRFVGSCTIGTDHLDTGWLERRGIAWSAAPGCNANSVVEYVFCALAALGLDWAPWLGKEGRSFGIVGCGNVGGLLQKRLRVLDIPCAVYDPWLPDNPDASDLDTVLRQDVICLHAPLVKKGPHPSFHMIGAEQLARIKDGAVLISAGRGAVVDNRALLALLCKGKRFTTVLDVWENEPDIDTALLDLVDMGTPHIAGYSLDGKLAGTAMIRKALERSGLSSPLSPVWGRGGKPGWSPALPRICSCKSTIPAKTTSACAPLPKVESPCPKPSTACAGNTPNAWSFPTTASKALDSMKHNCITWKSWA